MQSYLRSSAVGNEGADDVTHLLIQVDKSGKETIGLW